ncbi:hypothetical protein LINPERHAP2_LOCUS12502, partial [Linum perenne]
KNKLAFLNSPLALTNLPPHSPFHSSFIFFFIINIKHTDPLSRRNLPTPPTVSLILIMEEIKLLDLTLVPVGLILMLSYHLWLLSQVMNHPSNTTIGVNAINRRFWARAMMAEPSKNGILAVQTLRNNIMASTLLATTAIMLCSLIVMLLAGNPGARSAEGLSIRYYSHASLLINVPTNNNTTGYGEYVVRSLNRGGYFWSLGLRGFYFSLPMFMWIFGPIPMFSSCLLLVFVLYFLDFTSDTQIMDLKVTPTLPPPVNIPGQCNV